MQPVKVTCCYFILLIFIHLVYSTSFLNVHRTGVEEDYSARDHVLTGLREVYQSSKNNKNVSPSTKKQEKMHLEMAKSMRQTSLETYAKT